MSLCRVFGLLGHSKRNDGTLVSGYATLYQYQIFFGKDLYDGKVLDGSTNVPHMPGHLLVLEHTARPLTKTIRSASTMKHGSMGCRSTGKVPSLDYPLKTFSLCLGNDIDHLHILEVINRQYVSSLKIVAVGKPDFLSNLLNVNPGLGRVTLGAIINFVWRLPLGIVSYLNGRITIGLHGLDLQDGAGACFDNSNRDKVVVSIVHLGHPKLLS